MELDEGVRMATWVVDVPPDQLRIGMPVSKDGTSLESLVRTCWVNPAATSAAPPAAAATAPANPPATAGTGAR